MFHYVKLPDQDAVQALDFSSQMNRKSKGIYARYVKRCLDIVLVTLAAPVVLLLVGVFALMIRRDGGPAFYWQERVGLDGKHFKCWKLRSMVVDADAKLAEYLDANPDAKVEWTVNQKLREDPRITPMGHFIRKTSIDELPQFLCIFLGDMSLVGPRPFMPEQKELYKDSAYYELRPGVTGYWQVSDRNETTFAERARFDNSYARDVSLWTDIKVLFQTVGAVVRATGV